MSMTTGSLAASSRSSSVAINLSQGRSPEKTRSGVMKGRLGALRGSTAACAESPSTPKNPIVELIDSDDDAFEKIAGMEESPGALLLLRVYPHLLQ